ncbi:YceI family protein [Acidocella sp. MX-AZ03]|uniref:YceI family protein n=1 Tax=Acidocella sp. MX-AZ03 TaxID=2697363 RepID=UPI0022DD4FE0|nr:YceI family protein [Acidocella sp. MX-AZ03]WBO60144.1 YceI family protein [Acidocella sp. MX-AZ03]
MKAGTYSVEPTHTRILFAVDHMGFTTWYGDFTNAAGTLTLDPKKLSASSFDITVPTDSVTTTNTTLDGELKSPEWFDAAKYPTIEFKSEKIVRTGKDTALVTGEFTFHGVTKPLTLRAKFNAGGINPLSKQYTIGFNLSGSLKRSDFNQKTYLPLIGDNVAITISAAFVQK